MSEKNNKRTLHILPTSKEIEQLYLNHGTFHEGDSGLDLFVVEDQIVKAGETAFLKLGIKCAAYDEENNGISWLAMPRSSISKTPLRLSNSSKENHCHEARKSSQIFLPASSCCSYLASLP